MAQRAKFVPKNKELISNSDDAASVLITKTISHFKKNLNFVVFDKQETDKPLGDPRGIFNNDDEEFFIRYSIRIIFVVQENHNFYFLCKVPFL